MKLTFTTLMAFFAGLLFAGAVLADQQRDQVQVQISADQLSSEQIRELQRSLQEHGIDPGPIDGVMGPLTRQGIQLFQRQEGLATTGNLNERTLDALGLEMQEFLGLSPEFAADRKQDRRADMKDQVQLQVSLDQLNSAQVLRLQQQLEEQGIDPGPIDGVMGPLTRQGIEIFQQQQEDLAVTGSLNKPTLEALDIEVDEFMGLSPAFE